MQLQEKRNYEVKGCKNNLTNKRKNRIVQFHYIAGVFIKINFLLCTPGNKSVLRNR
jgi:hypothetical protein